MEPCIVALPDAIDLARGESVPEFSRHRALRLRFHGRYRAGRRPRFPHASPGRAPGRHGQVVRRATARSSTPMQRPDLFGAVAEPQRRPLLRVRLLPRLREGVHARLAPRVALAAWLKRSPRREEEVATRTSRRSTSSRCLPVTRRQEGWCSRSPVRPRDWPAPREGLGALARARPAAGRSSTTTARSGALRLVFLDAGRRDEWSLHLGARMFAGARGSSVSA